MSETKSTSSMLFIIIGLVLVAGASGFFLYNQNKSAKPMSAKQEITEKVAQAQSAPQATSNTGSTSTTTSTGAAETVAIDLEKALAPRALGNPEAPVTIREYASLTCGHCGKFHNETFPQIKAEYIDTGKVYFIFNDFPLNGPAVHGSMVARCMDESRYFNFIGLLFKNQEDWAYDRNYITYLRQNAALAGLGNNAFDSCINNEELKQGVLDTMRAEQQKYSISSTPTFVINEDNVITGARDFDTYKTAIEAELAKAQ